MKRASLANAERIAVAHVGGFSHPSKMPCACWSTSNVHCNTGSIYRAEPGTTCEVCYAGGGCYRFPSTEAAMLRRWESLQLALREPAEASRWVDAFVDALTERAQATRDRLANGRGVGPDDGRVFRWHDSGDVAGLPHLRLIVQIAERAPSVRFWLPTREAGTLRQWLAEGGTVPANLTIRVSLKMIGPEVPPAWRLLEAVDGIKLSGVHDDERPMADGFTECGAYRRDGACGPCRACWSPRLNISYPRHGRDAK
jgi:hypothetical protein